MQRQKWWEIAKTQDEIQLFNLLARHPKFDWRTFTSILKTLGWTQNHLEQVVEPFIKSRIILFRNTKKNGIQLGYWERVDQFFDDQLDEEVLMDLEYDTKDPNVL